MSYRFKRQYAGPVQAVIFDWAGTLADYGSLAPVAAFTALFESEGIAITRAEARAPMGLEKRAHIAALLAMPRIAEVWRSKHEHAPSEAEIDALYARFIPLQLEAIRAHATPIPGARETLKWLRERRVGIGSSTGYSREMLQVLLEAAEVQGLQVDTAVSATEVAHARPHPDMALQNLMLLGARDVQACVKVDDTAPGIDAGLGAGMWTVAVYETGNALGMDLQERQGMAPSAAEAALRTAREGLARSGAHYVVPGVEALPEVISDIEARLGRGEKP